MSERWKRWLLIGGVVLLFAIPFVWAAVSNLDKPDSEEPSTEQPDNGEETNPDEEATNDDEEGGYYWGVDSASLTTSELLTCTKENYGTPSVWGRYLETKEGVSAGLTTEEVQLLHDNGIRILVIYNNFEDATGYENGLQEAEQAVSFAQEIGVPEGVALFGDIEPTYPVDSAFIQGWYDGVANSPYTPGLYGVFESDAELTVAFNAAAEENPDVVNNTVIWTSYPSVGITTEANAPTYQAEGPVNSLLYGWQYGIEAETCNIDTNWFTADMLDYLWVPAE